MCSSFLFPFIFFFQIFGYSFHMAFDLVGLETSKEPGKEDWVLLKFIKNGG